LEDKRVGGRIIQKLDVLNVINVIVIGWEGVDCIHLPWDREKWLAFMSMIMNDFSGSIKCGE
jgi:hypothetical protein